MTKRTRDKEYCRQAQPSGKTIAEAQEGAKGSFSQGNWASQGSQAEVGVLD